MHLLSIDDLGPEDARQVIDRAEQLRAGAAPLELGSPLIGSVFLEASLRTQSGFAAAARLRGQCLPVNGSRYTPTVPSETLNDTLRTLSGYVDLIVLRPDIALDVEYVRSTVSTPVINGGDVGPFFEHPTQALVDLMAIRTLAGPVHRQRIAICGDLRMRSVTSLLKLFEFEPPASLAAFQPPSLAEVRTADWGELKVDQQDTISLHDVDVLYIAGMRHDSVPIEERQRFILTSAHLGTMASEGVVLCPMPCIDEISSEARDDRRAKMFEQSDLGLFVRQAVLERMLME